MLGDPTGQDAVVRSRVHSAQASRPTDATASSGCSGANHEMAPELPSASTTSLLQTGQPMAK